MGLVRGYMRLVRGVCGAILGGSAYCHGLDAFLNWDFRVFAA